MSTSIMEFEKPIVELEKQIDELRRTAEKRQLSMEEEIVPLERKLDELRRTVYTSLTPLQRVQVARNARRPFTLDYLQLAFTDCIELHGDRLYRDDAAIVGGWARLDGDTVMVIGHQRGRDTKENLKRNFGMPHPEGYRKALRLMKMAEKFKRPVFCFIDTPGAYPGIGAEERGQARAIAQNLLEMAGLKTPMISIVIGEGGSGGALAIGMGDRLLMCENAWYSVISPEGCAAILFRDAARAQEAATALKLTAPELKGLGVIDDIIPEPQGGAHRDPAATAKALRAALVKYLAEL